MCKIEKIGFRCAKWKNFLHPLMWMLMSPIFLSLNLMPTYISPLVINDNIFSLINSKDTIDIDVVETCITKSINELQKDRFA